jgi:hypothetical protein
MVEKSDSDSEQTRDWEVPDRGRGIFTKDDRKYLLGEKELSGQSERNMRYRIRERFINSLLDLRLAYNLSKKDEKKIFSDERVLSEDIREASMGVPLILSHSQYRNSTDKMASEVESLFELWDGYLPVYKESHEDDMVPLYDYHISASIEIEKLATDFSDLLASKFSSEFEDIPLDEAEEFMKNAIAEKLDKDTPEDEEVHPEDVDLSLFDADEEQESS